MIYLIFWIKKNPDGHQSWQVVRLFPTLIKHVHCQALDFLSQAKLLTWNIKSTEKAYDCKRTFWENLCALWQGIMLACILWIWRNHKFQFTASEQFAESPHPKSASWTMVYWSRSNVLHKRMENVPGSFRFLMLLSFACFSVEWEQFCNCFS